MAGQILNPGAFPPGSSAVFIDLINRLSKLLDDTGETATGAEQTAGEAGKLAQEAKDDARNAQNDATDAKQAASVAQDAAEDAQFEAGLAQQAAQNVQDDFDTNGVKKDVSTLQVMTGPLSVGTELRISNVKVLGGRITGWTASTGTVSRAGLNADLAFTVGATYSQSEMQAVADALVEVRKLAAALQAADTSHGLIGA